MDTESIALEGKHNMKNAMAATSVAKLMQIRKRQSVKVYLVFKVWNTVLRKY
jgi:UDP-N-acetylmuramoylalanine-D-glutamate ligase